MRGSTQVNGYLNVISVIMAAMFFGIFIVMTYDRCIDSIRYLHILDVRIYDSVNYDNLP